MMLAKRNISSDGEESCHMFVYKDERSNGKESNDGKKNERRTSGKEKLKEEANKEVKIRDEHCLLSWVMRSSHNHW